VTGVVISRLHGADRTVPGISTWISLSTRGQPVDGAG
jgi:hypothetical protein